MMERMFSQLISILTMSEMLQNSPNTRRDGENKMGSLYEHKKSMRSCGTQFLPPKGIIILWRYGSLS